MSSSSDPSGSAARHSPSGKPAAQEFPRGWVYPSTTRARSPRGGDPREAWVAFAHNLRWKYVKSGVESPCSLLDFRRDPCLVLDRLDSGATWADVEGVVCPFEGNADGGPALCVPGRRRSQHCKGAVVIVANSESERDGWLIALRVRIAPWQALAQRATELVRSEGPHSANIRDLRRAIYEQVASNRLLNADSTADVGATSQVEVNAAASEVIDVSETVARTSALLDLVQTVARIVKVAGEKAAGAVETAEAVANITKCVSVVGGVFQAVAITVRCIRMVSEASDGHRCFPGLYSELIGLLNCTWDCAMLVVDPEAAIDHLRVDHVFRVQDECMMTLGEIEEQLMRSWVMQAWKASVVAETKSKSRRYIRMWWSLLTREGSLSTCEGLLINTRINQS